MSCLLFFQEGTGTNTDWFLAQSGFSYLCSWSKKAFMDDKDEEVISEKLWPWTWKYWGSTPRVAFWRPHITSLFRPSSRQTAFLHCSKVANGGCTSWPLDLCYLVLFVLFFKVNLVVFRIKLLLWKECVVLCSPLHFHWPSIHSQHRSVSICKINYLWNCCSVNQATSSTLTCPMARDSRPFSSLLLPLLQKQVLWKTFLLKIT